MMDLGETVKVEPKVYFDALEALPPAFSAVRIDDNCNYFAMGEMAKHADDGTPMYHSFWTTVDHKCYGCLCPLPYIKVEKIPADIKDAKEVYNG